MAVWYQAADFFLKRLDAEDAHGLAIRLLKSGLAPQDRRVDPPSLAVQAWGRTLPNPIGLAAGKTVVVASSRGGIYSTSDAGRAMEHQESYLQIVFGFFGITDVRFVRAEGVAMGDAPKAQAIAAAEQEIKALDTAANESAAALAA